MATRIPDGVRQYALEKGVQTDLEKLDIDQDGEVSKADIDAAVSTYDTVRPDGKLAGDEQAAMQAAFEKPALARNSIRANSAMATRQSTGQLRDQLLGEVNDWARRAGDQLSDHHMGSLSAAQRFVGFVGDTHAGVSKFNASTGSLIWALSINVPVNLAAVTLPLLVSDEAEPDLVAMQARLTDAFEASLKEHRAAVDTLRNELSAEIRQAAIAGDEPKLEQLQERVRTELATVDEVPSANEQLRDLVLDYAERHGLQIYGGEDVEAVAGQYFVGYRGFFEGMTGKVEGTDVANFLNELATGDEGLKQECAINLDPAKAGEIARSLVRQWRPTE